MALSVFLNQLQRYQTLTLSKGNTVSENGKLLQRATGQHCQQHSHCATTAQDQDCFRHHLGGKVNKWFLYTETWVKSRLSVTVKQKQQRKKHYLKPRGREGKASVPRVTLPESLTSSSLPSPVASAAPYTPRSSVTQARLLELLFLSGSF